MTGPLNRDPDAGAKLLARWIGYAWDGIQEGRIADRGFPQWAFDGIGHKHFQGGKQDLRDLAAEIAAAQNAAWLNARPFAEYHEDMGPVLWWRFPIDEPPYVGAPEDYGQAVRISVNRGAADYQCEPPNMLINVGGWPGYHTHFTPIPIPEPPSA